MNILNEFIFIDSHICCQNMLHICSLSSAMSVIYSFAFKLYYISFCSLSTALYMSNLVSILLPFCW